MNDGGKQELNTSMAYSNTSPRSLYSKMTKQTSNILKVGDHQKTGLLDQSYDASEKHTGSHSFVQGSDNDILETSNNEYKEVELEFVDDSYEVSRTSETPHDYNFNIPHGIEKVSSKQSKLKSYSKA